MKPAILLPAHAPNVYLAARLYAAMGLSVLACSGKKPALSHWAHLQSRAATSPTIDLWNSTGLLENVGIICGAVSGNLAVIDLDGAAAVNRFEAIFPELTDTYAVRSGSGQGKHFYYFCDRLPPTTLYKHPGGNFELRANGMYVVAPPSVHPDSLRNYTVAQETDIRHVSDLQQVVELLRSLIADKHGGEMPPPANAVKVVNATAYGRAALIGECDKVRAAFVGARNSVLYEAALRMGSLITDGKIGRADVEQALFNAAHALSETDGEGATRRTIDSGINAGMENSRERSKRA